MKHLIHVRLPGTLLGKPGHVATLIIIDCFGYSMASWWDNCCSNFTNHFYIRKVTFHLTWREEWGWYSLEQDSVKLKMNGDSVGAFRYDDLPLLGAKSQGQFLMILCVWSYFLGKAGYFLEEKGKARSVVLFSLCKPRTYMSLGL